MAKPYVTVELVLHGVDSTVTIADYVDDNGRFVPLGTQAAAMLGRHDLVHFVDSNGVEVIIPYHAVVSYMVSKQTDDYTELEDEYCIADACVAEGTCNKSWTISFYNGETLLQQTIYKNGQTPIYEGATPVGETCEEFIGWNTTPDAETALASLPAATDTESYYAIFDTITYEVTWMNGETELDTDDVACGEVPSYTGETPTGTGTFLGWNTDSTAETALGSLPAVSEDVTYYAIFGA